MEINSYQEECRKTDVGTAAQDCLNPGWLYYILGGVGEMGELTEKIKKLFRDKNGIIDDEFRDVLIKECGDVMWYLSRLLDHFDIRFDQVLITNIEKLTSRMERGKIHGDGDNR